MFLPGAWDSGSFVEGCVRAWLLFACSWARGGDFGSEVLLSFQVWIGLDELPELRKPHTDRSKDA